MFKILIWFTGIFFGLGLLFLGNYWWFSHSEVDRNLGIICMVGAGIYVLRTICMLIFLRKQKK